MWKQGKKWSVEMSIFQSDTLRQIKEFGSVDEVLNDNQVNYKGSSTQGSNGQGSSDQGSSNQGLNDQGSKI